MRRTLSLYAALLAAASALPAAGPPCLPCAGIDVADPGTAAAALRDSLPLAEEARLYVRWRHSLSAPWDPAAAVAVDAAGGAPWVELLFATPAPLIDHAGALEAELAAAAAVAAAAGPLSHFQLRWQPAAGAWDVEQYGFLFKRAAVAVQGARADARVFPAPLPPDPRAVRSLYEQDVAPYLDGLSLLAPVAGEQLPAIQEVLADLDPGRPLVVEGLPFPSSAALALTQAARLAAAGAAVAFFDLPHPRADQLRPLVVLANELRGELAFDPYSVPAGADAWAFVREDLGLRVLVQAGAGPVELLFSDPQLQHPQRVDLESGEPQDLFGLGRGPEGLRVPLESGDAVVLLRLERALPEAPGSLAEEVTVETERQLPVEEILRRLQVFEDAQARRLRHYRARNTTHLRFAGAGATAVEVTFQGDFFFRQGEGFDWAWEELYVNGVKWRGKRLPEIPLIQPEKAAALPLAIHLGREYRYRLRGTAEVEGRPTWVVDFTPADAARGSAEKLYQGTVWIDRQHYGRVRTRALQLGLEGEVISNEEVMHYRPVDADGNPAHWAPDAFWLPLRVTGQQLLSVINTATAIEKETLLSAVRINDSGFAAARQEVLASEVTMVRDTERGLRYLVHPEDGGERVVKEGFDNDKLFVIGGVFYDDALDYPLPLAGANYFSFDVKGTGQQLNVFFAGALLVADVAQPRLFGSRFDFGADLFALAVPLTDTLYRDDREVPAEEVEALPASFEVKLGRPIGNFFRLGASYDLGYRNYSRTDETAAELTLPSDHLLHSFEVDGRYARAGYRLSFAASWSLRSRWEPWGMPAQVAAFDDASEDFVRWEVRAAKTWHLRRFQKLGLELDAVGGRDLDRFSKYQFGFFGGTRVHGYQSNRVRAEEALAAHASYGFEIGQLLRLEGVVDAAWASDEESGLSDELLAGVGLVGSFMGPWQTVMQVDVGVPVAGPDDGFVLYLVFLKLFR
ncbi:MAG TPA: hypothetical protein VMT16_13910 [Thermoanaerobaculia bacterium]|nr:hypothetical protein [Thermoanaerobaculia bacterium]